MENEQLMKRPSTNWNYFQNFEYTIPITPDTRTRRQKIVGKIKWHAWKRWQCWWQYDRERTIERYQEWWRERP